MTLAAKKTVALCESQPVTAEGLRALLTTTPDLEFVARLDSLPSAVDLVRDHPPAVLVLDKAFGAQAVLECLEALRAFPHTTAPVIWGVSITDAEALRFVQAGAKGIIRKSADLDTLLLCLGCAADGAVWMEQGLLLSRLKAPRDAASGLTPREQQIAELVTLGLKNREIALELGIRPGTVKVHLKHIFEKTGARGRFALALTGLEAKKPANPGDTKTFAAGWRDSTSDRTDC